MPKVYSVVAKCIGRLRETTCVPPADVPQSEKVTADMGEPPAELAARSGRPVRLLGSDPFRPSICPHTDRLPAVG